MILDSLPALTNHLWQSTLFAVAAGLLTLALRRNSARVRHWLWLSASVKFLIPVSLLVALGNQLSWTKQAPPPQFSAVIEQISQPFAAPFAFTLSPATSPESPSRALFLLLAVWASGFAIVVISWGRRWALVRADLRAAVPLNMPLPIPVKSSATLREPGVFGIFHPVLLLPHGITERLTP